MPLCSFFARKVSNHSFVKLLFSIIDAVSDALGAETRNLAAGDSPDARGQGGAVAEQEVAGAPEVSDNPDARGAESTAPTGGGGAQPGWRHGSCWRLIFDSN